MSERYRHYLRDRYRVLSAYIGGILIVVGLTMLAPLLLLPLFPDEIALAPAFLISAVPVVVAGVGLRVRVDTSEARSPNLQEGMVAILIAWVLAIVVGALPLMMISSLDFTQAIFESTSGWTTTGLSVVDVERAPRLVLFYRSVIQLIGGAGFAIIVLSAITGPTGSGLSIAEGREDQLAPHVRRSAEIVIRIYLAYCVFGIIALMIAGMNWFDAVNHAFSALSTGGFSTRAESIGYYDSALIELVIIVLMLLGTLNYLTAYVLWQGKFKAVRKNGELRLMSVLIPVGVLLIFLSVGLSEYAADATKGIRVALFEVTSALSTTGFSTEPYTDWSSTGWMVLILAMLIGGGSGSTSGGIKLFRIYVLIKALIWEVRMAFLPQHAVNEAIIWRGDKQSLLSDKQIRRIALFVFLYFMLFFVLVIVITAHGHDIGAAMFESASTLSTVGLSVGITAPDAPWTLLWAQSVGMLLGRLEFFAFLIGITKLIRDAGDLLHPIRARH